MVRQIRDPVAQPFKVIGRVQAGIGPDHPAAFFSGGIFHGLHQQPADALLLALRGNRQMGQPGHARVPFHPFDHPHHFPGLVIYRHPMLAERLIIILFRAPRLSPGFAQHMVAQGIIGLEIFFGRGCTDDDHETIIYQPGLYIFELNRE